MDRQPLAGVRIGVFGKGGSGKSTVTVFLARALRRLGHQVVVLDGDSTNLGMSAALGADRNPEPLLNHFGGMVFSGGAVTCPVDDPTPLEGADVLLSDLPPSFVGKTGDGISLLAAGKLGALGPGAGCDGPIVKIARDLRVRGRDTDPVLLVDFKAGFEDAARGAVTSVDLAVVVVDPTTAAVQMAKHLASLVAAIRAGGQPATAHLERPGLVESAQRVYREARVRGVLAVRNRAPDAQAEAYLGSALERLGVSVDGVFPEEREVAAQWLHGQALSSRRLDEAADALASAIVDLLRTLAAPPFAAT